jgi:hypothetical protein
MIKRISFALIATLLASQAWASTPPSGWHPAGSAADKYDMGVQAGDRRPGDRNAFIRALPDHQGFGTLMQTIDAKAYLGKRLRLSSYMRTKDAASAAMWMRIDGSGQHVVGFDNMESRPLRGDTDWQRYDIVLDVPAEAQAVAFGFLLTGKGEVLADDFKLEVVGKDVPVTGTNRPTLPSAPTNMDFTK